MTTPVRTVVDEAIAAIMDRPAEFQLGRFELRDKKTGLVFNITYNVGVSEPFEMRFGFWQGRRFMRAVNSLKAYHASACLRGAAKITTVS